jgi:hypothetical protein
MLEIILLNIVFWGVWYAIGSIPYALVKLAIDNYELLK